MKVLAVEDDPIAGMLLEATLRSLGHEVVRAADGEEAEDLAERHSTGTIVCDWKLPKVDGLELCRRLRANGRDYVYFILITGAEINDAAHEEARAAGVDDFLKKPVDPRELRLRLEVASRILGFISQVRQLESYLPICSYCKKVRDDKDYWHEIESYINSHSGTTFSHGICPDCYNRVMVPQLKAVGVANPPKTPWASS